MERENYGEMGDFVRNTEPRAISDVPVRDGRDFIQTARPSKPGSGPAKGSMERQLGYQPLTKRG